MEMKNYNKNLDKLIESCKLDIVMMVERIQSIKQRMKVSEATINHIKEYIAEIQKEIDELTAEKEAFTASLELLKNMPDISAKECTAMKYRYVYGWTIPQISEFMKTSTQTINRYLRKGESKIEVLCNTEGGECNV